MYASRISDVIPGAGLLAARGLRVAFDDLLEARVHADF